MKVLYVVGACLMKNTSANMSHNAYIQGLLENGCDVDIIMANDSWGEHDTALPRWTQAKYFEYEAISLQERFRSFAKERVFHMPPPTEICQPAGSTPTANQKDWRQIVRNTARKAYYAAFPNDPVYPLEHKWLRQAAKFHSNTVYDLVISNSSPAASHKLVLTLRERGRIRYARWVQIWEDPWYYDLYGGHTEQIRAEEHALLRQASEVFYVSPLTVEYQKQFYTDCADKMRYIPLPYLQIPEPEQTEKSKEISFGYFGDYYSKTRNLQPYYDALCESGTRGYIVGDSDLRLPETERITVMGRVTLDRLSEIQSKASVLVHLCNLRGGQIPGKIYHYSATDKPILFILDGTPKEMTALKQCFSAYQRYYFCENQASDILSAMKHLAADVASGSCACKPVLGFAPRNVVKKLLESSN